MNDEPMHADATEREGRLVGADRVIAVLTELAEHPLGITLDELAGTLQSSKPTVHRALATLRRAGLADLAGRGVYVLGDEYLRLAFRNLDGRPETVRIQPLLEELAVTYGETAHYAVLSGTDIVYRAKMDPPQGAVRLTSAIGGRNPAYRTAVGKALLSGRLSTVQELLDWFGAFPLEQKTDHTLTTPEALLDDLDATRRTRVRHRRPGERARRQLHRDPDPPRRLRHTDGRDQHQRRDLPLPAASSRRRGARHPRDDRPPPRASRTRLGRDSGGCDPQTRRVPLAKSSTPRVVRTEIPNTPPCGLA